jgi:endoglucanase
MPELADLDVVHSGRGYQPMLVSHYKAEWWDGSKGMPIPTYPCTYEGKYWNANRYGSFYQPWRDVQGNGSPSTYWRIRLLQVYRQFDVALAWFKDLFDIYRESKLGIFAVGV